ncbi:hypothetical protein [Streptomyces tagetis]|nr:hypothetical protein [Streptomyces sp. RG38]
MNNPVSAQATLFFRTRSGKEIDNVGHVRIRLPESLQIRPTVKKV